MRAKMGPGGRIQFSPEAWRELKKFAGQEYEILASGESILLKRIPTSPARRKK
jgi:hypothetical protein